MTHTRLPCRVERVRAACPDPHHASSPRHEAASWREVARLAMAFAAACEEIYQWSLVLVVPGDIVRDLSPNRRMNRWTRAANTRRWRTAVRLLWKDSGAVIFQPGVHIHATIRRGRIVDDDNAIAAVKAARDGLWGEGAMLGGDSAYWVKSFAVCQETGAHWKDAPELVIRITGERVQL